MKNEDAKHLIDIVAAGKKTPGQAISEQRIHYDYRGLAEVMVKIRDYLEDDTEFQALVKECAEVYLRKKNEELSDENIVRAKDMVWDAMGMIGDLDRILEETEVQSDIAAGLATMV